MPRYYYKDFVDGSLHFTRAPFVGWTEPTGPLNTRYAMFARRTETMLIPHYLLTSETKRLLPALPGRTIEVGQQVELSESFTFGPTLTFEKGKRGTVTGIDADRARIDWEDGDRFWLSKNLIAPITT